ncbi:MAG: DUF4331 family protein [Gemmatimonadales bacterium]
MRILSLRRSALRAAVLAALVAGCSDTTGPDTMGDRSPLENRDAMQVERFGLPAITTVFIPSNQDDAYNAAQPANDRATYGAVVQAGLQAFGHPDPVGLSNALLPDIQPYNTGQQTGFLNGRRLQDDVMTAELGLIFGMNGALNDDHVDANDRAFPMTFPYLAAPFLQ